MQEVGCLIHIMEFEITTYNLGVGSNFVFML
jgi:hypothetical protein